MARGPAPMRSNTDSAGESLIAQGTRVRGNVLGEGDLRVSGQIEGSVSVSGDVSIDEGGAVVGNVEGGAVSISGALTGDVVARGAVAIRAGSKVVGDMGGAEVSLEEGASFTGRIEAQFELPAELTSKR